MMPAPSASTAATISTTDIGNTDSKGFANLDIAHVFEQEGHDLPEILFWALAAALGVTAIQARRRLWAWVVSPLRRGR